MTSIAITLPAGTAAEHPGIATPRRSARRQRAASRPLWWRLLAWSQRNR